MSGILKLLKSKRSFLFTIWLLLLLAGLLVAIKTGEYIFVLIFGIITIIPAVLYALNKKVLHKMNLQYKDFFSPDGKRNIDCLVIGDCYDVSEYLPPNYEYIQIAAPKRGILSDYEILRHTHSILKENGTIYMPVQDKHKDNGLTIFDFPIFHPITVKKYNIRNFTKKKQFPILYSPIGSLGLLLKNTKKKARCVENMDTRIDKFCQERGYQIIYIQF